MKELLILLSPGFWSIKNDVVRFNRIFYRRSFFYLVSGVLFIGLITKLLNSGMARLQGMSSEVFGILLIKGYSLIFLIIFFVQAISGFVISLNTYYQSRELEVLFTSPVDRASLFFARLLETHMKASWMLVVFGAPLLVSAGLFYNAGIFFYIYAIALFIVFSAIPVNFGIGAAILISGFFPIVRLRKFLISSGVIAVLLLVTIFRIFRPERFVNPELFANLTLFVSELNTPSFILFPNRWLSGSIFDFLGKKSDIDTLIFISLLFLTAYVSALFVYMVFRRYHYRGWRILPEGDNLSGEGKAALTQREGAISKYAGNFMGMVDAQSRGLIKKDILYQIRDVQTIHQMLIITSLIVIYIFSIASLPLNWEDYALRLKFIISFFNLGLILIIIAAVCSRVVYSAVVSEANSLWILKTSPITPKKYILTRFLFFFVPICIAGQLLTIFSSFFIGAGKTFIFINSITTLFLTCSLVALSMTFGVSDMRQSLSDSSQNQIRTGNTAQMIISVFLILLTLLIGIVPTFLYFLKEANQGAFSLKALAAIGAAMLTLFVLNLIVTVFSIRRGIRKISKMQLEF
jgi:ABC-2 type transport system permease protein